MGGRFALVAISLLALLFAFSQFAPNQFESLQSILSARLFEAILVGTFSTILVLAFVYVITGTKNENVRWALRPVLLEKWASRTKRRHLANALKAYFDDRMIGWSATWVKCRSRLIMRLPTVLWNG